MSDPDQKPVRGRPRKKSSDAVLDTAMHAYWKNDPVDVSVNAICQMAEISKPSLYRTFGNEDGLTLAALDRYAQLVLSDIFAILQRGTGMHDTLEALIEFASADPRMATGCLFYKMRAGKHRLGPETRKRVDEIDAAARLGYTDFLQTRRDSGDWPGKISVEAGATYLSEQIAFAFTQRAAGMEPSDIRDLLKMSLSVL